MVGYSHWILLIWKVLIFVGCSYQQESTSSFPISWHGIDAEVLENGGYHCYVRCLAKCVLDTRQVESLNETCAPKCRLYDKQDLCKSSDTTCWSRCGTLFRDRDNASPPSTPDNVTVAYALFPQPTPHEAVLTWETVNDAAVYVIKYVDISQEGTQASTFLKVSSKNSYHFTRPHLCSKYAFAVAAVSPHGVSQFSEPVSLEGPKPVIPNPSYVLISAELIDEPFNANPDDPSGHNYNTTVVVLIGFTPPPNWNLTDEITRIDASVHVVDAGTPRLSFFTEPKRIANEAQFEVHLPGAVADTFAYCKFMFTVEKIFTACNDQDAAWCPPYVYNPNLNESTPGLLVQINCQDIRNGGCPYKPAAIQPSCGYKDVSTDVTHDYGRDTADVTVYFMGHNDPYGNHPVLWYNVTYGEGQKGTDTAQSILFNLTKILGHMHIQNDTSNFTLPKLEIGKVYVVYICTVYDSRSQLLVGDWNEFQRYAVDLSTLKGQLPPVSSSLDKQLNLVTLIVVPVLIAILILCALVAFFVIRKRRTKKTLDEMGVEYADDGDGRYVTLKKRYDHWEIDRQRLHVDENNKLGAGAFGAVYKGRVVGTLTKNRLSRSVLAEHWMQAENCEVAVKMLPAYADDVSKSEFLKEINLMKQLGFNERLVNMLGCVTANDPLCLIVEYCSEGDLLNYLRKRRKYIIELQEKGVDINNLTETSGVDFEMVLCKKDLISFAWQISVGLEYLSERGYIHRDVAARNILVSRGKRAKVGDFGLCRYSCSDPVYLSKGGRLPIRWMALEAIKHYEYTSKSDVWSYGVLLFEIVTLGGSPYPGVQQQDMEAYLESGQRMEQPESCPYELYEVMLDCWNADPQKRPTFTKLREGMRLMLEHITEDYYYMGLIGYRDYYNAAYQADGESAVFRQSIASVNAAPSSPTDTISFDDSNVFDGPPSPPPDDPQSTNTHSVSSPPPLPPRLKPRRLSSVGGDSVTSLDDTACSSPGATSVGPARHDSTSSEQALLTPTHFGDKHGGFPKFFKFNTPSKLAPLPAVSEEEQQVQNDGGAAG